MANLFHYRVFVETIGCTRRLPAASVPCCINSLRSISMISKVLMSTNLRIDLLKWEHFCKMMSLIFAVPWHLPYLRCFPWELLLLISNYPIRSQGDLYSGWFAIHQSHGSPVYLQSLSLCHPCSCRAHSYRTRLYPTGCFFHRDSVSNDVVRYPADAPDKMTAFAAEYQLPLFICMMKASLAAGPMMPRVHPDIYLFDAALKTIPQRSNRWIKT